MNQNAKRYARLPLALALGAMCLGGATVASAETTNSIYGNFRWSVNYVDVAPAAGGASVDTIRADDNQSRLGLRGEVKGSDLTAFYHWESGLTSDAGDTNFSGRLYYAGVKGGFGALTVGRHSPAYKVGGTSVNPFGDTGVANVNGEYAPTGAAFGLSGMTNGFANNTIAYTSPKLGPVTVNAAIYIDDSADNDHDYAAGVAYAGGPITAGFQYYDANTKPIPNPFVGVTAAERAEAALTGITIPTGASIARGPWANASDLRAYRAHGSFKTGPLTLGASVEMLDPKAQGSNETMFYFVSATYAVTPELRLAASVGLRDFDGLDTASGAASDGLGINIGAFYNVLPNTTVYALGSMVDFDRDNKDDTLVVSAGLIYNFNMKL
jgi:predicted porin